jgi:POT family proton-dependent oligopeptide transporter
MGHPKGLFYLAFTEAWERFSYYGMTALVVLFMVNQLLLPGHVEHISGFSGFRAAIESIVGPLSTQALASQIFGLYSGFVYFTPLLGGIIADRWIGQRSAVVIGASSMSAGHIAMAFDQSFLLALLLLVIGSGFLKGNISAQVGALYPPEDEARRTRTGLWVALRLWRCRDLHASWPCHLSLRIPLLAGPRGTAKKRGRHSTDHK